MEEVLEVLVTINDQNGETNSLASKVIRVSIEDVNESPEFAIEELGTSVLENTMSSIVPLMTVTAEDEDAGQSLRYSVSDEVNFRINANGELYLLLSQDYEGLGADKVLSITVTADDDQGELNSISTKEVKITITDGNDEPEFTELLSSVEVSEDELSGYVLGTITAVDEDAGDVLSYRVSDELNFAIDGGGELSLARELDYESLGVNKVLTVIVRADDGQGETNSVISQVIRVSVTDVDDTAPEIDGTLSGEMSVNEGVMGVVGTVSADDVDTNNADLTYSTNDGRFSIGNDGELRISVLTIDYEESDTNVFANGTVQVMVTVSDGVRETMVSFDVSINDVNDHAPVIDSISNLYGGAGDVIEEDAGRTKIGVISVSDGDGTVANRHRMFTTSDARFEVEANGDIYFTPENISVSSLDFMATITVSDGEHAAVSRTITVTVNNTDGIEFLTIGDQRFSVLENEVGRFDILATAGTADIMYSIVSGNVDGFAITSGGELSLSAKDYESLGAEKTFSVIVTATSGSDVESATMTVTIQDANDQAPVFVGSVLSNGQLLNEGEAGIVGTVSASDGDTVGSLMYRVGDVRFSILTQDGKGILRAEAGAIDYEDTSLVSDGTTSVLITVSDGVADVSLSFEVSLVDVNDNAPTISISPHFDLATAIEEDGGRTLIGTAMIADGDIEAINRQLSLSTASPNFEVDSTDNRIYFTPEDIFTAGQLEYIGTITVSDGFHPAVTETIRILVNNTDGDLELSISDQQFSVMENTEGSFDILAEAGTASIMYSIASGNVDGFSIMGNSLILGAKDFEGYALGENVLSVIVTVNTDDFEKSATISVTISDENEAPEIMVQELDVDEGVSLVGQLMANDVDAGDTIMYSLSDARFTVTNGGELSLATVGDYEMERELEVLVTVRDTAGLSSSAIVKVKINDVLDNDVIGGIGFNDGLLYSWHDASVRESFVDSGDNPVSEGVMWRNGWINQEKSII